MFGDEEDITPIAALGLQTAVRWTTPKMHRRMCELCPPELNVFLSILRRNDRYEKEPRRRTFTRAGDHELGKQTQELQRCQSHPGPSVYVLNERFRGKRGAVQCFRTQMQSYRFGRTMLQMMLLAAVERLYFHGRHEPFGCEAEGCDAWIEQPDAFTTHEVQMRLSDVQHFHPEGYHALPEPYEAVFAAGKKRLDDVKERLWQNNVSVAG